MSSADPASAADTAARRRRDPAQQAQRGRLPGAVRADQRERLTFVDLERDAVEGEVARRLDGLASGTRDESAAELTELGADRGVRRASLAEALPDVFEPDGPHATR